MNRNYLDLEHLNNFPKGVRSVYVNGKRVKKEDVEIERSFLEVSSSDYDVSNIPDHINYLPKKQLKMANPLPIQYEAETFHLQKDYLSHRY